MYRLAVTRPVPADPTASDSDWGDVDDADANAFRAYLDSITGLETIRAAKRRSHRLLDPDAGDRLLDVGCGTGDDVRALAERVGDDGTVVGLDASESLTRDARDRTARASPARFAVGDAHDLPLAPDRFDGARAERVLQHLPDPQAALDELVRVTRPGGRVVVTDPDWGTLVVTAPGADPDRTRRLLDPEWSCARNGRVGRRLRRRAADAGLVDVGAEAATLTLTGFESADDVLGLESRVATLREAGVLADSEGSEWLARLREADRDDAFFASLSLFTVVGTVPE